MASFENGFENDQAAGLRRIMAEPKPRIVSVLSATDNLQHQARTINNLAATLTEQGHEVLVMHASHTAPNAFKGYGINSPLSLIDVTQGYTHLHETLYQTDVGFAVAQLMPSNHVNIPLHKHNALLLDQAIAQLQQEYDVILVAAMLNKNHVLPTNSLNNGEILIQLSCNPESIKQGYTLMKQICGQLGRRGFGVLVEGANDRQAALIFRNMSLVARRYMQIDLEFFGAIPKDEHLSQAEKVGRSVVEAFPMAQATAAFHALAQRLSYPTNIAADFQQASFI